MGQISFVEGKYIDKHFSSFDYKEHQKQKQEIKEESMKKTRKTIIRTTAAAVCLMAAFILFQNRMLAGIQSPYVALMERDGEKIIAQKKGGRRIYPASMTKIMTCLVALEQVSDLDRRVIMEDSMIRTAKEQGASLAGFEPGESVSIRDLLYGMMLPSGAECCLRISKYLEGSEEKMADLAIEFPFVGNGIKEHTV